MKKLTEIKLLIANNRQEKALELLLEKAIVLKDKELTNEIILKKSQFEKLNKIERTGTEKPEYILREFNSFNFSLLLTIDSINEKNEIFSTDSNLKNSLIDDLTLITNKNDTLFSTNQEKLDVLFNQNSLLLDNILGQFIDKINSIPQISSKVSTTLFNRIASPKTIQDLDKIIISKVRLNKKLFFWYDRVLIVNALTISLFSKFEETKFSILCDFLSDFEEHVFQNALVGIVMGINGIRKEELSTDIKKRLKEIRKIPRVQESLLYVSILIGFKAYNQKEFIGYVKQRNNPQEYLKLLKQIRSHVKIPKNIDSSSILNDYVRLINEVNTKEEIDELFTNFETNLDISNPYAIDYSDFFLTPSHWFIPFQTENPIIEKIIRESQINYNLRELAKNLESSFLFSQKDKFSIFVSLNQLSNEELDFINSICNLDSNLLRNDIHSTLNFNPKKLFYFLHILMSYTDFFDYYIKSPLNPLLIQQLEIEQVSKFELLTNQSQQKELKGDQKFLEGNFNEAIHFYFEACSENQPNDKVLRKIGDTLFRLKNYKETIKVYQNLKNLDNDLIIIKTLAECYFNLNDFKKSFIYLVKLEDSNHVDENILFMIGICYSHFGTYWKSLNYLEILFNKEPENNLLLMSLIINSHHGKYFLKMKKYCKIYLKIFPDSKWGFKKFIESMKN